MRSNDSVIQHSSPIRSENGISYRDLHKNGKLDIYEDPQQPLEARVDDLLSQMSLAEKAGMMFINGVVVNEDGSLEEKPDATSKKMCPMIQRLHFKCLAMD